MFYIFILTIKISKKLHKVYIITFGEMLRSSCNFSLSEPTGGNSLKYNRGVKAFSCMLILQRLCSEKSGKGKHNLRENYNLIFSIVNY